MAFLAESWSMDPQKIVGKPISGLVSWYELDRMYLHFQGDKAEIIALSRERGVTIESFKAIGSKVVEGIAVTEVPKVLVLPPLLTRLVVNNPDLMVLAPRRVWSGQRPRYAVWWSNDVELTARKTG